MKHKPELLSITEAARLGRKDDFFGNVKAEVIPKLIAQGRLKTSTHKGELSVFNDAEFRRLMQFGIESFVYNQQGWSFTAAKAPIDEVAQVLTKRGGVLSYVQNIKPQKLRAEAQLQVQANRRNIFIVKTTVSDWTVIIQTVHWIQQCDMLVGLLLAAELSALLNTTALTAWDDDFSGSTAVVCRKGKKKNVLTTEEDWGEFYALFYEKGIFVPECFISLRKGDAHLLLARPSEIERADRAVIAIPEGSRSDSPHVFYKLGMLAMLASSDTPDEISFQTQTVDGLWNQVQANLGCK